MDWQKYSQWMMRLNGFDYKLISLDHHFSSTTSLTVITDKTSPVNDVSLFKMIVLQKLGSFGKATSKCLCSKINRLFRS